MEDPDIEKGHFNDGQINPRIAVLSTDMPYLENKQKLFECARDSRSTSQPNQLNSILESLSEDDRKKLCQERDNQGNTALHYAVKTGNLDLCHQLYKTGADLNAWGKNGMRPLPFAARYGDEKRAEDVWKCMQWILEENSRLKKEEVVNACEFDRYGFTILHYAIQNSNWGKNPIVAQKLIESGNYKLADIDKQGNTSLHLAAEFDKQERHKILDIFLGNKNISKEDLKKCIETRNKQGKTPLHIACGVGNPESVKQLLEATKDLEIKVPSIIDSPDNDGQHPLHLAIESGNLEMMKILMEEGVAASKEAIKCAVRFVHKILFKFLFTFFLQDRQCGRF